MIRATGALVVAAAILGCSSSSGDGLSPFFSPSALRASTKTIQFSDRETRIAYVADREAGTIAVLDLDKERLLDTDGGDDFDATPLVAGGELTALAVDDRAELPRVYAADGAGRVVVGFRLKAVDSDPDKVLVHAPLDLGGALVGRVSKPIFIDRGRASSPFIPDLEYDPAGLDAEAFKLTFRGADEGYEVEGSRAGEQAKFARENARYETDSGRVSFTVTRGGEDTRGTDEFYFGVAGAKPLALAGAPQDLIVDGGTLYVVTSDPAEVVAFDMDTVTVTGTVALTDGGPDPMPGKAALVGDHLYVPNRANGTLFDVNKSTLALAVLQSDVPTTAVASVEDGSTLLLAHAGAKEVSFFDPVAETKEVVRTVDVPTGFCTYRVEGRDYALVATLSAFADVLDVERRRRVDRSDRSGSESFDDNLEFFDAGAESAPEIISVDTKDGKTKTERWQLTYEGVLPGTAGAQVTVTGTTAALAAGSWTEWKVAAGDELVIGNEAIEIVDVASDTDLTLVSAPAQQGMHGAKVRARGTYVAVGTESGTQRNRIKENIVYKSDQAEITLKIRSSIVLPVTRGDFFAFTTFDGVNSIALSSGGVYSQALCLEPPGRSEPKGYVTRQSTGSVSIVNLSSLRQSRSVR